MGAPFFCLEEMEIMMKEINESHDDVQPVDLLTQSMPWLFGAGIAAGHLLTASSCTLPQQGRCAVCGGCVVALGSLVGWAMLKKRQGDDFYSQ
ncbi:MAG: hypothetical protein GQ581_00130 [Methyloprofundus sp.]|nr:hypothetical protein [Methyloprofundus sp.]